MPNEPRLPEIERGTEVFAVDPLTIRAHFEVDYIHSYKQDTPFFHGLQKRKLLGSHCGKCDYRYATPRSHCMYCGGKTEWFELPPAPVYAKSMNTQRSAGGRIRAAHRRSRSARVDHQLHQPGRHRHPRAARRGTPGDRPVQRGHRPPAALRRALRRGA